MKPTFTCPGKQGDAMLQWPVAYQFCKQTQTRCDVWLDENTCKALVPLFESQACVDEVKLIKGVENWSCGGQPWHFDLPTSAHKDRTIYHLGFRGFPSRQITLETAENVKLPIKIDRSALESEPAFLFDGIEPKRRLLLHGQPVYGHTKTTPGFWKFLAGISRELPDLFDEIVWIGSDRDREVGTRTYPDWKDFDDHGSFLEVARLMAGSACVIACGSSMAAMAQVLKIPCVRVHDPIGDNPKVVWSGLGENQLNDTELGLRTAWPAWRDQWLGVPS